VVDLFGHVQLLVEDVQLPTPADEFDRIAM